MGKLLLGPESSSKLLAGGSDGQLTKKIIKV